MTFDFAAAADEVVAAALALAGFSATGLAVALGAAFFAAGLAAVLAGAFAAIGFTAALGVAFFVARLAAALGAAFFAAGFAAALGTGLAAAFFAAGFAAAFFTAAGAAVFFADTGFAAPADVVFFFADSPDALLAVPEPFGFAAATAFFALVVMPTSFSVIEEHVQLERRY